VITKEWLKDQIERLTILEIDAEQQLKEAERESMCAKVNLRVAGARVKELECVKQELTWQLERMSKEGSTEA